MSGRIPDLYSFRHILPNLYLESPVLNVSSILRNRSSVESFTRPISLGSMSRWAVTMASASMAHGGRTLAFLTTLLAAAINGYQDRYYLDIRNIPVGRDIPVTHGQTGCQKRVSGKSAKASYSGMQAARRLHICTYNLIGIDLWSVKLTLQGRKIITWV